MTRFAQRGFTLIEAIIAVAIIGILAALAVYMFGKTHDKAKASEVAVMFAEFSAKEEAYMVENDVYFSSAASEASPHPATPAGPDTPQEVAPMPGEWNTLRIEPSEPNLYCSYVAIAGDGGDATNIGTTASSEFGFTAPDAHWYYVLAQCDWDSDPSAYSLYFTASDRDGIHKRYEGR